MSKILFFADLHIHPHKKSTARLDDCVKVLEWIFQTAIDKQIKSIVFLGDLFHDRQKIDVLVYQKTFDLFKKYFFEHQDLKMYLLLGNHDLWHLQKWDVTSVTPLGIIPNVHIVDKPCTLDIEGHPVSFLPYTDNPIMDIERITNNNDYKILCSHLAIDGAKLNTMHNTTTEITVEHDGNIIKVDKTVFQKWNQVFLGHYHGAQIIDNVEYVGSPLQLSFGEAFTHKHVLIYDLIDKTKEYVRNTFSPQHFIIPAEDVEKYELNGNFLKILVDDVSNAAVVELRNKLVNENKVGSLEIKLKDKPINEHVVEDAKAILGKETEMLGKYIDLQTTDLNKERLLQIGKTICETKQI